MTTQKKGRICLVLALLIPLLTAAAVLVLIRCMQRQVEARDRKEFSAGSFVEQLQWQPARQQPGGLVLVSGELWLKEGWQEYWLPTHSYRGRSYSLNLHGAVEEEDAVYLFPTRIQLPQAEASSLDPDHFGPCQLEVLIPQELYREEGLALTLEGEDYAWIEREGSQT